MDVRIGVTQAAREVSLEMADDTDLEALRAQIDGALLGDGEKVLWLNDKRGRQVGVPAHKIAYVEIGAPEDRRIGFGG